MPKTRTNYPVVTFTVAVLALVAFSVKGLRSQIPAPQNENRLVAAEEDFLEVGTRQAVPWQEFGEEAFAEARRLDRPIFILVGDVSSRSARFADARVFTHPDVIDELRTGYVCIRVDASQNPALRASWLPARAAAIGRDPMFQLWVLEPDGRVVSGAMMNYRNPPIVHFWVLSFLRNSAQARRALPAAPRRDATTGATTSDVPRTELGQMDWEDRQLLVTSKLIPERVPNLRLHSQRLMERLDPITGGFPLNGLQSLQPPAWDLVMNYGQPGDATRVLGPMLRSGIVDWMDGGFRRRANNLDWTGLEYDQHVSQMGDVMASLARYVALTQDPIAREAVRRAQVALLEGFREGQYIRAYRIGDEDERGRSARSSFAPFELRDLFRSADREFLRAHLGMRVEENPEMVLRVKDARVLTDPDLRSRFDRLRQRLVEARRQVPPQYGGDRQLDAAADAVARLLESGRVLGDTATMAAAGNLVDPLRNFRVGEDDVRHSLRVGSAQNRCLADYLAYADAMLQDYLCFGRLPSLVDGRVVLYAALERFSPAPGVLYAGEPSPALLGPADPPGPPFTDDLGESAVATAIRLFTTYGDLEETLQLPRVESRTPLRQVASELVFKSAPAVDAWPDGTSGVLMAALEERKNQWIAALGPGSVDRANRLVALAPFARVMPLVGELKPYWRDRAPGLYRVRKGQVEGPLTDDQAREIASARGQVPAGMDPGRANAP